MAEEVRHLLPQPRRTHYNPLQRAPANVVVPYLPLAPEKDNLDRGAVSEESLSSHCARPTCDETAGQEIVSVQYTYGESPM